MTDYAASEKGAIIFLIEKDESERDRMRRAIEHAGYVAMPLADVDAAIALLGHDALCDCIILSVDAMNNDPTRFDELQAASQSPPPTVLYGMDSGTKLVLHCLNRGASDFLAKPVTDEELIQAVEALVAHDAVPADSTDSEAIHGASYVGGWIELTASSRLEQFRRLQRFSDALFASRLPRDVCDDLKMAVEEVGRNAVEWGNRFDPDKQVHVSYCIFDDRIIIKVEDEGEGFAHNTLPDPTRDPVKTMRDRQDAGKRPGGYGVFLIQKLVDETIYNEKGNTVLLIKYLPEAELPAGEKA